MASLDKELARHLEERIAGETGANFELREATNVSGGCIHKAWKLHGGERDYFLKTNKTSLLGSLQAEAAGLLALEQTEALKVPHPIAWGSWEETAYLLMEHLELGIGNAGTQSRLGTQLAELHRVTGHAFGWQTDNFIGASAQYNQEHDDWTAFWTNCRLKPQIDWARSNGLSDPRLDALLDAVPRLLAEHQPQPSLLHGDLWGGNIGALPDGTPVAFDPACYYGDRETDLAFSEMFGGFRADFYEAYQKAWPLPTGFGRRKRLYNLYHELNHYNLFGGHYGNQAIGTADWLLNEL